MNIKVFKDIHEMSGAFFDLLVDEFTHAQFQNRTYHIALSGGSTPLKIFQILSQFPLGKMDWKFLHIYWGDERCVAPENTESNFGNFWNTILKLIDIPSENIHRIHGENIAELECINYSEVLQKFPPLLQGLPRFDLTILGIGEDGHTASIFPDAMEMFHSDELCYVAIHPQTKQERITLSLKVINNSERVLFLATGEGKADVISKIIRKEEGSENFPAAFVNPGTGKLTWFLDAEAGSKLI